MSPHAASETPRVILKSRRALPFFSRHPWVFEGAIGSISGQPDVGEQVELHSHEGQFIAWGLFNPHSQIRVRLYSWDPAQPIDREFFAARLDEAISLRRQLFSGLGSETACRMVFSEADGLSGLMVDRYGDWLTLQVTSLAIAQRIEPLLELLQDKLSPRGIILRTEKGMTEHEQLDVEDGLIVGEPPPVALPILDAGIRYEVDLNQGQKTGFYLDQRDNRIAAARYFPPDADVLDAFTYSGGFGLAAALHANAKSVLAVDTSDGALDLARRNAELNGVASRFEFARADVFDHLEVLLAQSRRFDAICLDPPKLARTRKGIDRAMKGYFSLNRRAFDLLKPGGILVTCSCSGIVTRADFEDMLSRVALKAGRRMQILEVRGQAPDHPISTWCPETEYLKCFICRVI